VTDRSPRPAWRRASGAAPRAGSLAQGAAALPPGPVVPAARGVRGPATLTPPRRGALPCRHLERPPRGAQRTPAVTPGSHPGRGPRQASGQRFVACHIRVTPPGRT